MSEYSTPADLVAARRRALTRTVGRPLQTPPADGSPLPEERRVFLLEEVRDLYWNDLEWENVTGEEELDGGPLVELTFPGVVAFVRGLLLTEVPGDSPVGPSPRPQVVDDFMDFLAGRVLELRQALEGGEAEDPAAAQQDVRMTEELLDQVLLIYHGISPEEVGPNQMGSGRPEAE